MNKVIVFWILMVMANTSFGQILSNDSHQKIINLTLVEYWGKARLKDGSFVKPDSEKDRNTVPIASVNASDVIRVGELSSLADWCSLEWQSNYTSTTNAARSYGLSGKQVAFVGFLHGVTMGVVSRAIQGRVCSPALKNKITVRLNEISNKSINFEPSHQLR